MRMQWSFKRYKGVVPPGETALGADGSSAAPPTGNFDQEQSNAFYGKFMSNSGWPTHRIAVSYAYLDNTGAQAVNGDLPAQVWVWDTETSLWYAPGDVVNLKANHLNYFDVVALLDGLYVKARQGQNTPSQGGVEVYLIVDDPGGAAADGTYVFGLGLDLTTLPV